ncbi:hypothetical protein SH2C18_09800 [Clostridium sediminicola]
MKIKSILEENLFKFVGIIALLIGSATVCSACMLFIHQPECPEELLG